MNSIEKTLFRIGLVLPHRFRRLKIPIAYIRYYLQRLLVFRKGGRPVIIVAMPKSGSTWLENIFMTFNNTLSIMPPACIVYEQVYGNSHQQKFTKPILKWAKNKSVVIKLHSSYSSEFYKEVQDLNAIFILLYRDVHEASASHLSYVAKTPFHPEYSMVRNDKDGVQERFETDMEKWLNSWQSNVPGELIVNYQEMLDNPVQTLSRIMRYYKIKGDIEGAIAYNTIEKMRDRSPHKKFYRGSKFKE